MSEQRSERAEAELASPRGIYATLDRMGQTIGRRIE